MVLPRIKETRATQGRIERLRLARLTPMERRKQSKQVDEYSNKESELKNRSSWDLRGKMTDMETLLHLEKKRLEELSKAKALREYANQKEHHQLKNALIRLNDLEKENKNLKTQHKQKLKAIRANHRIYNQQLQDENLIHISRQKTLDIQTSDMERRYLSVLDVVEKKREKKDEFRSRIDVLMIKNERLDIEMNHLERELDESNYILKNSDAIIQKNQIELNQVDTYLKRLEAKVVRAHVVRDRLAATVKDLEESKQSRSWKLAHQNDKQTPDVTSTYDSNDANSYYYNVDNIS